ncbi:hypothetical protein HX788_10490 [Pseudomonas edaphica]|uniref:Uncharacterized protein n=1 Tax=Pseudomonas edaphica TaxID=2006980 RepID=A0A7Y8E3W7_9PSED|nr:MULTISPECIES: hypothetical protein [Pseudomonas]NWC47864.1 hypothetical protein [Pseudomonas sp. IPO3747]NWE07521.1 hypothetical protein [Pseudomonas edaphica]NWE84807.1 hypothetical protein [Pseudomonas edaphica]
MISDSNLAEMVPSALTGVTVGIGSQILLFGDKASVLIQCPFACDIDRVRTWGHGEDASTSTLLFDFLNLDVEEFSIDDFGVLTIIFSTKMNLKIFPEKNGLESYVVSTRRDVFPILVW